MTERQSFEWRSKRCVLESKKTVLSFLAFGYTGKTKRIKASREECAEVYDGWVKFVRNDVFRSFLCVVCLFFQARSCT
ncbi:hypothetical protein J26TS2_14760 [Shouchella clausii]|nr:hypothetical protein J26TS2_14760 [Shouchella clausii]